ncbi:MAG: DNA polymerase [Actinomycetota bacterium]|nr:DNA polymerase [Actinomycetota bacterium]
MLVTKLNFELALEEIASSGASALFCDTETTGLEIMEGRDHILGLSLDTGQKSFYFSFAHVERYVKEDDGTYRLPTDADDEWTVTYEPNLDHDDLVRLVEFVYDTDRWMTLWWNAGFDLLVLHKETGLWPKTMRDVMLAAHLADENSSAALTELAKRHPTNKRRPQPSFKLKEQGLLVDENAKAEEEELKKKAKKGGMAGLPAEAVAPYAEKDAVLTRLLYQYYAPKLEHDLTVDLWARVCRYRIVVCQMSRRGILIDRPLLEEYRQEAAVRVWDLLCDLKEMVGDPEFNPNSPAQICEYLKYPSSRAEVLQKFCERGWNYKNVVVKDDEGNPVMTNKFDPKTETWERVPKTRLQRHKLDKDKQFFCHQLLEYRGWSKMLGTYYDAYPDKLDEEGALHPSFSLHGTVSGRLSSSNPNAQQIPRRNDRAKVKDIFVAREGYALVEVDYKQAELVVGAHICGQADMLAIMRDGSDIHWATALETHRKLAFLTYRKMTGEDEDSWAMVYTRLSDAGVDEVAKVDPIWKELRSVAKRISFGIFYGLGAAALAKQLDIPEAEARAYITGYHKARPRLHRFYEIFENEARSHGEIRMWTGRVCHYDRWIPPNKALAHMVQGSAAEVMRVALTKMGQEFPEKYDGHPLLQGHDSVLFEVPLAPDGEPYPEHLAAIKNTMEYRDWSPKNELVDLQPRHIDFPGKENFFCPMRIDMKWGFSWGDMPHDVKGWVEDASALAYHPKQDRQMAEGVTTP